jgi:diguanylate cyclase (GGDEF)-like protein
VDDPFLLLGASVVGAATAAVATVGKYGNRLRRLRRALANEQQFALGGVQGNGDWRILSRLANEDSSRLAVGFDRERRVVFVSDSCRIVAGCDPRMLENDGLFSMVHSQDVPLLQSILAGDDLKEPRIRIGRQDGQIAWLAVQRLNAEEDGGLLLLFSDITATVQTEHHLADTRNRLERIMRRDSLTGLANREGFLSDAERAIARGEPVAIFFVDLDRFNAVNDVHGHRLADEVLREVGARLDRATVNDLSVARLGADEFALLVRAVDGDQSLAERARALIRAIGAPLRCGAQTLDISATIGVAVDRRDGDDPNALLRSAHIAMSLGKLSGGGCYRFFEPRMRAALEQDAKLKSELRSAIDIGQIVPFFQPLVRMRDSEIIGFEALARWEHPTLGVLLPVKFLTFVEEMGLSAAMFRAMLTRSCTAAQKWTRPVNLSLNISPHELLDATLPDVVRDILHATGFDGARLEVEITENALIDDSRIARDVLMRLRALGLSVVLDDFGTGFSSLYHLRELPFDKVKIDKSFVQTLDVDAESARYVAAIVGLCHALDLEMTAEGIETEATKERLHELGCTYGQGYLFGRPAPGEDAGRMLLTGQAAIAAE